MPPESPRSLRRRYLDWVEQQIEEYKESIPRAELLGLADDVVEELRMNPRGQYQLTELLLCDAMDRRIFRLLRLPTYRAWREARARAKEADPQPTLPGIGVST